MNAYYFQSVNDGISDLDLSWNSIRRKGAAALANGLKVKQDVLLYVLLIMFFKCLTLDVL